MKRFLLYIGITTLTIFLLSMTVSAQQVKYNHPELNWYTIETDHFQIHYHNGSERTAQAIAKIAESIYKPITDFYDYHEDKTYHFIVRDHDDFSNGAAYYYDDKIEIWASAMNFDLRGTHPWLLNVVSHEFAHMISLDRAKKFGDRIPAFYLQYWGYEKETRPDVLRGFPNQIVSFPVAGTTIPPWFAEGLAQYQSPDKAYDFWDSHRDMILRMAVLRDKLLTYEEMCSFGHNSLGNEMVYNAGFSLVNYIAKFYGQTALERITESMKAPWKLSLGSAIQSVLKKSEKELYREWHQYLQSMYSESVQTIRENIVQGEIIKSEGFGNFYPVWSPNGKKVAYLSNKGQDYLSLTSINMYDLQSNQNNVIKSGINSSVSFSEDGKKLVYAKKHRTNIYGSNYYDLFMVDLESEDEKRLTKGARARNPSFSPAGDRIVCIIGQDGTDNLAVYDVKSGDYHQITDFNHGEQIFHPNFSPDGESIVFDISTRHGRDIAMVDVNGQHLQYIINDQHDARTPVFHPDGEHIFFAWDKTGIFNIYQYNLQTKETAAMTNVLGGAFMPSFSPEHGLVYSLYTEDGYKIAHLKDPVSVSNNTYLAKNRLIRNESVSPISGSSLTSGNDHHGNNENNGSGENLDSQPYNNTYGAVNFMPRMMVDYGTLKLGTYLYSSDVLDKYQVFGGFAMNRMWDMDIFGIFEYRKFYPTIFLEIYNQIRHTSEGQDNYRYNLMEADLGLESHFFNKNNTARAMFTYSKYDGRIETTISGQEIKFGYTYMIGKSYSLLWRHNRIRPASDQAINPSGGRRFELRYDRQSNQFIKGFKMNSEYGTVVEDYDTYHYNQFSLEWEEYLELPWEHTLSAKLKGGYIDRPIDSFFNFFAGGILGLKGYPYYSIEGRKLLSSTLTYRFPLFDRLDVAFTPIKLDKLYAALFFEYGNAWDKGKAQWDQFKKDVGIQIRLDTFSFYNFPTRFFFDVAYGFDEVTKEYKYGSNKVIKKYGKEFRYYFGLAFDYID